ncbi:hypothetical protein KY290_026999 [Solanum tuberosum]|uniref:Uncharacterized protein n=1 Tax=Solanum tuberosum TaxID=4113 RepID=A0ABQ7UDT4_SOLTU|nr:hypothetical protein KY284_025962 [Solanum tuberosum]KAH0747767.1 hypothetical protein KY290_026999 [Solanum tuberosum]
MQEGANTYRESELIGHISPHLYTFSGLLELRYPESIGVPTNDISVRHLVEQVLCLLDVAVLEATSNKGIP